MLRELSSLVGVLESSSMGGASFCSVFVALLLLWGACEAKLERAANETRYRDGYSSLKIVVVDEGEGSRSFEGADGDGSDVAGIMVTLSESGLTYVKEVLVNEILAEITPLALPDIKAMVDSPIGRLSTQITHIELSGANVSYSDVDLEKTGITVFAGDIQARIRLHWYYEYSATYMPFPVNDGGWADVEVKICPFDFLTFEK